MKRNPARYLDMFEFTLNGGSLVECGVKYGITRERCRQLVTKGLNTLMHRMRGTPIPEHRWSFVVERRKHADFWRERIALAREELRQPAGAQHE